MLLKVSLYSHAKTRLWCTKPFFIWQKHFQWHKNIFWNTRFGANKNVYTHTKCIAIIFQCWFFIAMNHHIIVFYIRSKKGSPQNSIELLLLVICFLCLIRVLLHLVKIYIILKRTTLMSICMWPKTLYFFRYMVKELRTIYIRLHTTRQHLHLYRRWLRSTEMALYFAWDQVFVAPDYLNSPSRFELYLLVESEYFHMTLSSCK